MADEVIPQTSDEEVSVETTTEESQPEIQTQDSNETSTEVSGESTDKPASTGDTKPSKTQDVKPETKPLSRRSAAYRIQQLTTQLKEAKSQQQQPVREPEEWEETPQEDESQPSVAELVSKEVERRLNPVLSESTKAADDGEINELFSGEKAAERTKYEPKIREMWKLPQYKDTAAVDLYKIVSFDDAVSTATTKAIEDYKQAQKEAKESSGSGSTNTSNRTGNNGKSINDLSDEAFQERNNRIKAGLPV